MIVKIFSDHLSFVEESAETIARCCRISDKITARIIVSGGNTPLPIYQAFAEKKDVPFKNVELFQADERYVSPTHRDSNYFAIKNALGAKTANRLAAFHHFHTQKQIEEALDEYERKLQNIPFFDLAILGIGSDGHIASLFPHTKALIEKHRLTAHTTTDQFSVKNRLTITFPALLKSKNILVLLEGASKKHILDELQSSTKSFKEFPATKLLEHPNLTIHYWHR